MPAATRLALVLGAAGGAALTAHAALYTLTFPIQGTAINATNVIGAWGSSATAVNLSSGTQTALGGVPTGTIDAGQYNDQFTMYLDNGGILRVISNANGNSAGQFSVGDAFGVSGALNVGGTMYAIVVGTTSGIRALNLQNGQLTPIAGTYNFTNATGLDALMRPGGTVLGDILVGILRNPSFQDNVLTLYAAGSALQSFNSAFINGGYDGNMGDFSFNAGANALWFGTDEGTLFDRALDFSLYAVAPPTVSVSATNGSVAVSWTGRTLEASGALTNWVPVATAPGTGTQLLPPPPYTEPTTNTARFFRARW